jgi:CubicO group peptidase (beta-lactamase class C family)
MPPMAWIFSFSRLRSRPAALAALAGAAVAILFGGHRPAGGAAGTSGEGGGRDGGASAVSGSAAGGGEVRGAVGAALDAYLRRLEAFGFAGSVLVARRGEVLLDEGFGLADEASGEAYTPDTLFDVASVSKQFTAAAVLELEMEGRLRVEDALARFFPAAPADKAAITLHQLLTHTSGLPDVLGAEYEPVSREEMLRRAFAARLVVHPGTRFRYSNAGYSVLAAVVETVSRRPLGDFMRAKLFLPAGMRSTGFRLPPEDRRRLAHGFGLDGPWGTPLDHPWATDGPWWNLRGNGGVLSTSRDLYRWDQALAGDRVLSRPEREKLLTPYVHEGPHTPSRYAYGWSIAPGPDGRPVASHTGGNGVFDTDFRRYLDDRAVLIASSNRAAFSAVSAAAHLENRLFGLPDPDPPAPDRIDPELLRRCAGLYQLPARERLAVAVEGHGVRVAAEGPAGMALLLAGQDDAEREIMAGRTRKVAAALDGARRGDFEPLADLFGQSVEEVEPPYRAALQRLGRRLGALTGAAVLGSASLDGVPYTYARLIFERGARLAQYRWEGPTAETVRYTDRPAGYLYLPERRAKEAGEKSPGGSADPGAHSASRPEPGSGSGPGSGAGSRSLPFGTYDVRTGAVQRLRFELPPDGAGTAAWLVVQTPAGEVRAQRSTDPAPPPAPAPPPPIASAPPPPRPAGAPRAADSPPRS